MSADPQVSAELLISYTIFPNTSAQSLALRADVPWDELVQKIKDPPTYTAKAHCPLIVLAEFGDVRSAENSLRYAGNVLRVYGVEFDYDGNEIGIEEARATLQRANIKAVLYTTPTNRVKGPKNPEGGPRWRALFPFSEPELPEKRREYAGKANRLLWSSASKETFALSQSYYIGRVAGVPYEVLETQGRCINMAAEIEPEYLAEAEYMVRGYDTRTDAQLRQNFIEGHDRFQTMLTLSMRWAMAGRSAGEIEGALYDLLGANSINGDGTDLKTRVPGMGASAVHKAGETRKKNGYIAPEPAPLATPPESVTLRELKAMDIPEPPSLMGTFIREGTLGIVSAQKGVGKTMFCLGLAASAVTASEFLGWAVPKAFEVLYIDGEMHAYDMKDRSTKLTTPLRITPEQEGMLHYFIGSMEAGDIPKINHLDARVFLKTFLDAHPGIKLVIFDNFAVLTMLEPGDAHGAHAWAMVNDLLKDLRRRNVAAFVVAHHGKNDSAGVMGSAVSEFILDVSLALSAGEFDKVVTKVNGVFSKGRSMTPADKIPFAAEVGPTPDGMGLRWTREPSVPLDVKIEIALKHGMPASEVATEYGCNRSYVYKLRSQLIDAGELSSSGKPKREENTKKSSAYRKNRGSNE